MLPVSVRLKRSFTHVRLSTMNTFASHYLVDDWYRTFIFPFIRENRGRVKFIDEGDIYIYISLSFGLCALAVASGALGGSRKRSAAAVHPGFTRDRSKGPRVRRGIVVSRGRKIELACRWFAVVESKRLAVGAGRSSRERRDALVLFALVVRRELSSAWIAAWNVVFALSHTIRSEKRARALCSALVLSRSCVPSVKCVGDNDHSTRDKRPAV